MLVLNDYLKEIERMNEEIYALNEDYSKHLKNLFECEEDEDVKNLCYIFIKNQCLKNIDKSVNNFFTTMQCKKYELKIEMYNDGLDKNEEIRIAFDFGTIQSSKDIMFYIRKDMDGTAIDLAKRIELKDFNGKNIDRLINQIIKFKNY